ncbi:unnamed protein product [Lupinus luteus]|uniref:Uncharacterized protein n=1 Tax=Lupinus luteus TaxID=3873 RepID=A0AAV1WGC2_LUPLU
MAEGTKSKQLASNGITVVVTARDEKKGLESIEKLKQLDLPGHVVFHQLDVTDPASIRSLEDFVTNHFGKLDILVNNGGINGVVAKGEGACIAANYYGSKGMCEALIPLLKLSDSPRIVNITSTWGILEVLNS